MVKKPREQRLKSLAFYSPVETVIEEVLNLGFSEVASATVISDAKFWSKKIFKNGQESGCYYMRRSEDDKSIE
jgi:hypothetical protein